MKDYPITIGENTVQYIGYWGWYPVEFKERIINRLEDRLGVSRKQIEKAIFNESTVVFRKKSIFAKNKIKKCFFIQLDHPALMGKRKSLQYEKNMWQELYTSITRIGKKEIPQWKAQINKRINEINNKLKSM